MPRNSREEWKTYNSVFDNFTNRNLFKLGSQGYYTELLSIIAPGKEAVVFTAKKTDGSCVAVKVYRLETANFRKMFDYLRVDPRLPKLGKGSAAGDPKRRTIFSWTEREYRNLLLAREANVRAPMPIAYKDNILVMELIGDGSDASPLLKHQTPEDMRSFAEQSIEMLYAWAKAGMVHGDLSEYNIINHNEQPVWIDFSHSALLKAPNGVELLERDVKNLCAYFKKHGVAFDEKKVLATALKQVKQE